MTQPLALAQFAPPETGATDPHWMAIGRLDDIPPRGARTVGTPLGPVAVFRTAADEVFALFDRCPHKGGPLSQGIVHGRSVTCPLHGLVVDLATGASEGSDPACARTIPVRVEAEIIQLALPMAAPAVA